MQPDEAIRRWWLTRLSAGCQLTRLDDYQVGFDYKGVKDWKRAVAISALHTDYLECGQGPSIGRIAFMMMLRRVLGEVGKKRRLGWLLTGSGYQFVRPHRNFIYFKSLGYHKAVATIGGYNASQNKTDHRSDHW